MTRFAGQELPKGSRIALIANDAIGNWVMATPLLQMLRNELKPGALHLYCGNRTRELQAESDLADDCFELHGHSPAETLKLLEDERGQYEFVVNVESTGLSKTAAWILGENGYVAGPCLGPEGRGDLAFSNDDRGKLWQDKAWVANDLLLRYPFLKSGFISEIFARLCHLEGDLPTYKVPRAEPNLDVPDVIVSASASLPEKLWSAASWKDAIGYMQRKGFSVGLVGAKPKSQAQYWKGADVEQDLVDQGIVIDMRGAMTMPEVVGALGKAKLVLTIDNGILHLAVSTGVPTIGLYRHGIHRLWAPPYANLTVLTPGEGNAVDSISLERVKESIDRV